MQESKLRNDAQASSAHTKGTLVNIVKEGDLEALKVVAREHGDDAENFFHRNRDAVGASALHLCYLFHEHKHYELADWLVGMFPKLVEAQYVGPGDGRPSAYEGETVLHIAVVNGDLDRVRMLAKQAPRLLHYRATGSFFSW